MPILLLGNKDIDLISTRDKVYTPIYINNKIYNLLTAGDDIEKSIMDAITFIGSYLMLEHICIETKDDLKFHYHHKLANRDCGYKPYGFDAIKERTDAEGLFYENVTFKKEVTLGGEKFADTGVIRTKARRIITDTKDGEKLKEKEQKFILDLLKYHHNYEEKSKDLDYITVGKPENYEESRCFIIVNKNNEKKDFSVQKDLE